MISMIIGSLNHRITELAMKNRICCETQNLTERLFSGEKGNVFVCEQNSGVGRAGGRSLMHGTTRASLHKSSMNNFYPSGDMLSM